MKTLLIILAFISTLVFLTGCSDTPVKTRTELLEDYKLKYGIDPLKWSDEVKEQFSKEMNRAPISK